jgi:predicted membrane-bound dolichyl-phosphate-mannose-protein mannosyltransferase
MKAYARTLRNSIWPGPHPLALLTATLLLGLALRVACLTADRFHADEALYAGWALRIPDGDPLLLDVPVDKPPLYLYTLAGSLIAFGRSEFAARLPGLASSMLGIALLYRLGRRLYGTPAGLLAALFLALSPFDLLFARTAFTDSMLVMWMLAALWAAAAGRRFLAGIALGLAFATKQHALLAIPLAIALGWMHARPAPGTWGRRAGELGIYTLGFALPLAGVIAWDSARWANRPSYWHQSASSYGGLAWAPPAKWGERLIEWIGWARYLAGSRVLAVLAVLGIAALLVHGRRREPGTRETRLDTLFVAYGVSYILAHTVLQFSVWDRYLLPLAPLVALLLARIVVQIDRATRRGMEGAATSAPRGMETAPTHVSEPRGMETAPTHAGAPRGMETAATSTGTLCVLRVSVVPLLLRVLRISVVFLLFLSAWTAARNGYPIGGEHWAYQGLDQVAAYLKENAPPDAVLYHHWLRWHYSFYLYGTTFELRWWESGEHLRREALRTPERAQYIVLPDWRILDPDAEGIAFRPVYETRRQDGSVSLTVYRVEIHED